jgi:predicted dehydrogenase|tara:strand:- start:32 stop:949 length:918 start_codon:yes stop_codon:yes gene_type:complete
MRVLVIGYGSIGSRHTRVLINLGCKVSVLSKRVVEFEPCYDNLKIALKEEQPDYVVITNKTVEHYSTLLELSRLGYKGIVLVEKPLFHTLLQINVDQFKAVFVAYNMRFNPLIQKLRNFLKKEKVLSVQAYVGQYLPSWRPERDYRLSYSANKVEGGGVLRDLSHELDFITWIFGGWSSVTALGGHFSHLEIDSDDIFSIMGVTTECPIVTVQLNYLDRVTHREILINTEQHVVEVDFLQQTISIDDQVEKFDVERDLTYRLQHQAVLKEDYKYLCSIDDGIEVLKLIDAIESSACFKKRIWVDI